MEKSKKTKLKKYLALFVISIVLALLIFFFIGGKDSFSIFGNSSSNKIFGKNSPVQVPTETCKDGIQNQGETGVDCGGPCPNACPPSCSDGILNQDEEKTDCGGTICSACPTCSDGIQNQGERHTDCGGPCQACPPDCTDGIKNQDETGVDCGGTICGPCPTCDDKIQNQGEGGVDCGGPCPLACPPTCTDRIQNQGETGVDCGGPCPVCPPAIVTALTADELLKVKNAILSSEFISDLPKNGIVALHFFNYQNGQRVELDTILIGKDQILTSGTPDLTILLHSKYIAEITSTNLCEIIPKANTNGDLAVETSMSESSLLFKYAGIIKHRDCFGF